MYPIKINSLRVLSNKAVTTVLIGASKPEQIAENVEAANAPLFTDDEKAEVKKILLG